MRLLLSLFLSVFALCTLAQPEQVSSDFKGLKDYYAAYFPIGVAVAPSSFNGIDSALIVREFNSLTAENIMKMGPIQPREGQFNWKWADRMIEFAEEHGMKARGHTLCWHRQAPDWMFVDDKGETVSKEQLLERLRAHIFAVAGRYKGKIYAWDVVNEVVSDNPGEFFRNSKWYEICGEDYIIKAFEYAHEAAPDALLFYNDYNAVQPDKRARIVKLLGMLKARGVPIHGMGIQGHWSVFGPSETDIREAIEAYSSLGLQVQVTELDVSVYPPESGRRAKRPDEPEEFTPELAQKQMEQYRMFFRVFRDYKDAITGVTFWNVSDHSSWLDYFPVRGRKNYPLLFGQDRARKKAYDAVIDF
ncbi:MAG: endo-1,4-beta-xylanase [Phaeodactylibacter sp.]|nr:endo-1,4-beta-xylanase [Phaeodactylibacter sp.]MCB9286660.1 endo-1,4-beta-xylanase [Lewinellaceae bacterium]